MMKLSARALALIVIGGLAAPAWGQDAVHYLDPASKKEVILSGKIQEETPAFIRVKPAVGAVRSIPSSSVVDVQYELPGQARINYMKAAFDEKTVESSTKDADRQSALEEGLKLYRKIRSDATGKVKRHMDYKIARLLAFQAEADPSKAADAVAQLKTFCKYNPEAWQLPGALRLLAQLEAHRQDYAAAAKTYDQLAAIDGLPAAARQENAIRSADMLVRAKKYADAKKKLEDLGRALPADDPQRVRLDIALASCRGAEHELAPAVQSLEAIIAKPLGHELKAAAYNALGDCYRLNDKPEEARWAYLYVDVIYNKDREEQAKAVYWLGKVFKQLGDDKKAEQYRDRLEKDKRFAGLEYQRLAVADKSGGGGAGQ